MPTGKYTTADIAGRYSPTDVASVQASLPAGAAASLPEGATVLPGVPVPSRILNYVPASDSPSISSPSRLGPGAWSGIKNMVAHPLLTISGMGQPFVASGMAPGGIYPTTAPMGMGDTGRTALRYNTQVQGAAQEQQGQQGLYAAGHPMETIGNVAGPALLTAGLIKGAKLGPPALKGLVTGNLDAPIPGTDITPRQRYAAMRETGVQPDAAQATNSPILRMAKEVNRNSLTSSLLYENARARNLSALSDYTNQALDAMSPIENAQEGGAAVQQGLREHQAGLKAKATAGFHALDKQMGDKPIPGAAALQEQAKNIVAQNADYYSEHPVLEPKNAMAIVKNLARGGQEAKPTPKTIPGFGPETPPTVTPPRVPTYSELHRLRSDLLDFNNANPDFIKNQANSWISQLAGGADAAITNSEGGLTPEQVQTFRDANEAWKAAKEFDNPQNPLYHAARNIEPSKLVGGISNTPEMAQNLRGILGEQGIGPIRRGVAEKTLGTTPQGNFNFSTFEGNFNRRLSPEYRQSLYTPEQQAQLGNIGQTGSALNLESNPSGSAKLGQKMLEAGALAGSAFHPLALGSEALYHGGQYALGRAMNSPGVVNWLMRPGAPPVRSPIIPPLLLPSRR